MIGLAAVMAVTFAISGQPVGAVVLGLAVPVLIAIAYVDRRRGSSVQRRSDGDRVPTYGSSSFFGVAAIVIGALWLSDDRVLIGIFFVGVGVLTLAAFGPAFLRGRRRRSGDR